MARFSISLKETLTKLSIWLLLCNLASGWVYPFRNQSLSWDERVEDLVHRLSVYEIVNQTSVAVAHPPPAIARLGIQPYLFATECLRGYVHRNATAFPDSLGLGASFRYRVTVLLICKYSGTAHARVMFTNLAIACADQFNNCLLYTSPSPRDGLLSRMPSSA